MIKSLIEIGLSEKEATLYVASLELGSSTVLELAKTSKLKRTTIYSLIDSLIEKGLMIEEFKGFKKVYSPSEPKNLERILDTKKNLLENILPELSSIHNFQEG